MLKLTKTKRKTKRNTNTIIIILLSLTFLFYKYLIQLFPGIMTQHLMQIYNLNATGLGNLAACFFYSYAIMQLLAGPMLDKWGVRKLGSCALFLCAVGVLLFAISQIYMLAVIGRLLMGAGASFATIAYLKSAADWCSAKQFAFIGGILTTGVMLGAVLGEAPLAISVTHFGNSTTLYAVSSIGFCLAILYLIFMRDKAGQLEHGLSELLHGLIKIIKNQQNWILAIYSGLAFSPLAVFGGLWGVPFLMSAQAMHKPEAAALVSLCFVGFGIGGPLFGFLADINQRRKKWMQISLILSLICLSAIIYYPCNIYSNTSHMYTDAIISFLTLGFGIGTGGFMLGFAVAKENNPIWLAATIVGFINSGDAIFGATTEPLIGKLLDLHWQGKMLENARVFSPHSYHVSFTILILYLIAAFVITYFIKDRNPNK